MTAEFYLKVVNPGAKQFKHLFVADCEEKVYGVVLKYRVYWPQNTMAKAKAGVKAWADAQGRRVLDVREVQNVPIQQPE